MHFSIHDQVNGKICTMAFFDSALSYEVVRCCHSKEAVKMVDLCIQWVICLKTV